MGNEALRDLVGKMRSGRLSRRQFMTRAAAMGLSATAISGAFRQVPTRAQSGDVVTFWTTFTDPDLSIIKSMVDTYNGQATGLKAEVVQIPPAQVTDVTKLMTAVRGGTGPDVYHLDRFIVAQRAADGLLQDLSGLGADLSPYIAFARAEATYDGKPYALPFDTDTRALYYNKAMIQAAGFDPAELDQSKGPATWDRIKEMSDKINVKDSNGNYTTMGMIPWDNQGWHYTFGFSWGGQFFNQAACEVSPNDQPIVDAFQWVQDYCVALDANKVSAFANPQNQPGANPADNHFYTKTQAFAITGDWVINQLKTYAPDMDYGITWMPVPKAGDNSVTWAGGWSTVIPQGAKHPEDAWKFMQWFSGEEGQKIYTKQSAHLPTWESLLSEDDLFEERHKFFAQILPTAKNRPPLPVGAKYWDELTVAWQATYLNQGKPADLLATTKDRVDADLKQYCPVVIEDTGATGTPAAS
jgi:multiple sugar transport system substrate-binding protein